VRDRASGLVARQTRWTARQGRSRWGEDGCQAHLAGRIRFCFVFGTDARASGRSGVPADPRTHNDDREPVGMGA
jgi:hypothetical protein